METEEMVEAEKDSQRTFYPLRGGSGSDVIGGVSANAFLEFWGNDAIKANENNFSDEFHFESGNPARSSAGGKELGAVYRAYLPCVSSTEGLFFRKKEFFWKAFNLSIVPACVKIQLVRWDGFRAVCVRESEIEKLLAEGKSPLWGFGRPHPFLPEFPTHQRFAGPLTVPPPGAQENFEPIFLKIQQNRSGEERIYILEANWEGINTLRLVTWQPEEQAPGVLCEYEFSSRSGYVVGAVIDPEQMKKNAEALENLSRCARRSLRQTTWSQRAKK